MVITGGVYQLIKTSLIEGQVFIVSRNQDRGDINIPLTKSYVNSMYEGLDISWSTHKSRHFFKNMLMDWMRKNRQVDIGLIKELMGHKKTVDEDYGSYSWDYKIEVIDKVFNSI